MWCHLLLLDLSRFDLLSSVPHYTEILHMQRNTLTPPGWIKINIVLSWYLSFYSFLFLFIDSFLFLSLYFSLSLQGKELIFYYNKEVFEYIPFTAPLFAAHKTMMPQNLDNYILTKQCFHLLYFKHLPWISVYKLTFQAKKISTKLDADILDSAKIQTFTTEWPTSETVLLTINIHLLWQLLQTGTKNFHLKFGV